MSIGAVMIQLSDALDVPRSSAIGEIETARIVIVNPAAKLPVSAVRSTHQR